VTLAAATLFSAVALSLLMSAAWLIDRRTGRAGWVDVVWSLGTGAVGTLLALAPYGNISGRQVLVAALCSVWSVRLGSHIARRAGLHDDPRYAHFREKWGDRFPTRMFWLLQLQAAVALGLVLTMFLAAHNPAGLGVQDAAGTFLFVVSVAGEALADRQLARFRAASTNPADICDTGLWSRSRHPNYVFEWLVWVAYVPIAVDWRGGYPAGWLTVAGPILMYWLLVHISGIPPLEAHMRHSRGAVYVAYQARVNAFWPRIFPKGRQ